MNDYELALNNIEKALDMLHRHITDGTFNRPYGSIKKLKELIVKEEKYKWHDLRNNPNDLPNLGDEIIIAYECLLRGGKKEIVYLNFEVEERGISALQDGYLVGYKIVAWKEVELFEVSE